VNTVIPVAFAKIADELDLEHLLAAIKSSVPINPEQNLAATLSTFRDLKTFSGDLRTGFTGFSGLARIKVERKRNYRCH
jgi:hypothetical protein